MHLRRVFIWVILFTGGFLSLYSQNPSENMHLFSSWDDNTLQVRNGLKYNDIWGYESGGNQYVIFGSLQYIHFFNVTNPSNPVEVERIEGINMHNNQLNSSIWRDFKTFSHYAYASADEGREGLTIFNLNNLPNGVTKIYQDTTHFRRAHNIFIDVPMARLYVAGVGNNLIVYDLSSTPANPTHLATIDLRDVSGLNSGYVHDVYVKNDTAYCSHGYSGYCAYDLTNINSPEVISCINLTNGYNHSSWMTDDGAFLVYAEELPKGKPLVIINKDSFLNEQTSSWVPFKEPLLAPAHVDITPHNPFIMGDYLYVSYYEDGVVVFDISDPYNPFRTAYYDTYPENSNYNGTVGCWGVYPFFSNELIAGSDTKNGLFLMEIDFSPLAVDFTSFELICEDADKSFQINWTIGDQDKAKHMEIEYSTDGLEFEFLQSISSEAIATGSVKLRNLPNLRYIRIRAEDNRGEISYSPIRHTCKYELDIKVYPQPITGNQPLRIDHKLVQKPMRIELLNLYGTVAMSIDNWYGGSIDMDLSNLQSGLYVLSVSQENELKDRLKIIKQ